ncbi:putative lipoprotein [Tannerella forsythia 3313]|nr:putative lipoprotein [Tannerella forsythia 3313]
MRSAVSKQRAVCRVGANLSVRPFFVWCRGFSERKWRKWTRITPSCHSEQEAKRWGKRHRISAEG